MYVRDMEFTDSLWPQPSHRFAAGLVASVSRLSHMINEFERALRGTRPADARDLRARIRSARTKLDLTLLLTVQTMNYLHSGRHRVAL